MSDIKIKKTFDLLSKICAVAIAPSIGLSTVLSSIFFPLTAFFSLISGNTHKKFKLVMRNPVVWMFILFFLLILVGGVYSTAPLNEVIVSIRKYSKYLFIILHGG